MSAEGLRSQRRFLDALTDDELRALVGDEPSGGSWGWSGTVELDGHPLFVKRIPVTDVEAVAWPSTRNHFGLPVAYQYGVGSAGFGAAREVAAQAAATGWVEQGLTDAFPVLLHHRLVDRQPGGWEIPREREWYLSRWGDDPAIAAFVDARVAASHEVWLVSEHVPLRLAEWLVEHQDCVGDVLESLLAAAALLREHEMVHFDAHFENVQVDQLGDRICLTDFGLASSAAFDLGTGEREFLAAHRHYDVGEIVYSTTSVVSRLYSGLGEEDAARVRAAAGVADDAHQGTVFAALVAHAGTLADDGLLDLHPGYVAVLERFGQVIDYVGDLLWSLVRDTRKSARFDDAELVARLRDCGVSI